jgi:triosephosphate isomerase
MRKKIVAGNWKMNLNFSEAQQLTDTLVKNVSPSEKVEVVIAPSFPYLYPLKQKTEHSAVAVAAQNIHWENAGAYTGEVSAPMLKSIGITNVILGHSERRQYFGEDEALLNKKVRRALENGLNIIFCVGEALDDRENGKHFDVVQKQLTGALDGLSPTEWKKIVIAYEPVWAIGTGRTASPGQAQEMHRFIRETVEKTAGKDIAENIRILYGGSVKPANAADIFAQPDVDGGLIGGASLKAGDFLAIIEAAEKS